MGENNGQGPSWRRLKAARQALSASGSASEKEGAIPRLHTFSDDEWCAMTLPEREVVMKNERFLRGESSEPSQAPKPSSREEGEQAAPKAPPSEPGIRRQRKIYGARISKAPVAAARGVRELNFRRRRLDARIARFQRESIRCQNST